MLLMALNRMLNSMEPLSFDSLTKTDVVRRYIYIYIICQLHKTRHCGVGAHQRQGKKEERKKSEKSEEKERNQGAEGETPTRIPGNQCAHRG